MWIALWSSLATLFVALVVANLGASEKKIERQLERRYDTGDAQFRRALGVLLGPQILDGNRAEVLRNGDRIFPAMLDAIRGARRTISFETYIYWSGSIGREFADALIERAIASVKVHVLLDRIGSVKMDQLRQPLVPPQRRGQPPTCWTPASPPSSRASSATTVSGHGPSPWRCGSAAPGARSSPSAPPRCCAANSEHSSV